MDAYQISSDGTPRSQAKAKSFGHLPELKCNVCARTWFNTEAWFPHVGLSNLKIKSQYVLEKPVSFECIQHLKNFLRPATDADKMPPGAGFGPITATLSTSPTDFVFASLNHLLASVHALKVLKKTGFDFISASGEVRLGRTQSELWRPIHVPVPSLLSKKSVGELRHDRCRQCGGVIRTLSRDEEWEVLNSHEYEFDLAALPGRAGLAMDDDQCCIVATPDFIEVYNKLNLTGLTFQKNGIWV